MFRFLYLGVFTIAREHSWHPVECKLKVYLVFCALQNSTYQVLVMTIDKYIAIKWPHRAATYSTPRRAKFIVAVVSVWVIIYNTPHLFFSGIVGKECFGYVISGIITQVYSWLTLVINAIITIGNHIVFNTNDSNLHEILYTKFVDRDTPEKYARLIFFYHIRQKLYHSNNGINFFLYCISGQKFRSDLKELLCCSMIP